MPGTAFSLRDPGRSLQDLLLALGLGDGAWKELLGSVEVYPDTLVERARLSDALGAMRAIAAAYRGALTAKLRFKYPPVDEDADLESKNRVGDPEDLELRVDLSDKD